MDRASLKPKPLGVVWICSRQPVLISGLTEILRPEAQIHLGQGPPTDTTSMSILFCSNGATDPASEVKELRELVPGAPIVVLGSENKLRIARDVLRAGARGFIHLGMEPSQIVRALSVALKGELAVPRELLNQLIVGEDAPPPDLAILTPRQREILKLVAEGQTNAQIAKRLFLSESTVKQHLRSAYKLLGVRNRTEAAKLLRGEEIR